LLALAGLYNRAQCTATLPGLAGFQIRAQFRKPLLGLAERGGFKAELNSRCTRLLLPSGFPERPSRQIHPTSCPERSGRSSRRMCPRSPPKRSCPGGVGTVKRTLRTPLPTSPSRRQQTKTYKRFRTRPHNTGEGGNPVCKLGVYISQTFWNTVNSRCVRRRPLLQPWASQRSNEGDRAARVAGAPADESNLATHFGHLKLEGEFVIDSGIARKSPSCTLKQKLLELLARQGGRQQCASHPAPILLRC
jgi:hypothetical protein